MNNLNSGGKEEVYIVEALLEGIPVDSVSLGNGIIIEGPLAVILLGGIEVYFIAVFVILVLFLICYAIKDMLDAIIGKVQKRENQQKPKLR